MKQKFSIFAFIFSLLLVFNACKEKLAEVEVPVVNAKPVVFCFLTPGESEITAVVSMSQPVFGKQSYQNPVVTDAKVVIYDQLGNMDTLRYNSSDQAYTLSSVGYPIRPNYTYTIEAFGKSGWKASGKTTIPGNAVQLTEATITEIKSGGMSDSRSRFTFKWNDPSGESNYYRVGGANYFISFPDTSEYDLGSAYMDDKLDDGKEIVVTMESNGYGFGSSNRAYLLTCDKAYYEYMRRRELYAGDNPFASPLPMYQNVSGGLGVVGSYRKTNKNIN